MGAVPTLHPIQVSGTSLKVDSRRRSGLSSCLRGDEPT